MYIHAGWLFCIPVALLVGLFAGERWAQWTIDKELHVLYHMVDQYRQRNWNKRQAD